MKAKIGREKYYKILEVNGFEHTNQIKDIKTGNKILAEMED